MCVKVVNPVLLTYLSNVNYLYYCLQILNNDCNYEYLANNHLGKDQTPTAIKGVVWNGAYVSIR